MLVHKEELSNSLWQNRSLTGQSVTFTGLPEGAVRSGTDRNMWTDNCAKSGLTREDDKGEALSMSGVTTPVRRLKTT